VCWRKPAGHQPGLFDEGKAQEPDCLELRAGGDRGFRQREHLRRYKARQCRARRIAYWRMPAQRLEER
jgi:hypothetical protein